MKQAEIRKIIIQDLLKKGEMKGFDNLFDIYKPSTLARHMGMNYAIFSKKRIDSTRWVCSDLYTMASLSGIDYRVLFDWVHKAHEKNLSKIKKAK